MNIFENLIKDTAIIGIGALNATESTPGSPSTRIVEYTFRVFTHAASITIYSPPLSKADINKADEWLKKYLHIREKIAEQIGELKQNS